MGGVSRKSAQEVGDWSVGKAWGGARAYYRAYMFVGGRKWECL